VEIANVRIHGTTKKVPKNVFENEEKCKLGCLPVDDFVFSCSQKATLNTNCHLCYKGFYYSAPYQYVGLELDVIEINNLLKIYHNGVEIAVHTVGSVNNERYITDKSHYPDSKNVTAKDIQDRQRIDMTDIGQGALEFYEAFISQDNMGKYNYRSITGILALKKKYDKNTINGACKRALHYGSLTYTMVKKICEKGLVMLPMEANETYINTSPTEVTRDLSEYADLCEIGGLYNE
jgi:hypothetical protein